MCNIIQFPLDIRYRVVGINRDGRIIVQILNTPQQFIMRVEEILNNSALSRKFPKRQISWLSEIAQLNRGEQLGKPAESIF